MTPDSASRDVLDLSLENRSGDLERILDEADGFMESRSLSAKKTYAVRLALEELLTNVVKYAYDEEGGHRIGVRIDLGEPGGVTIDDDGRPFNPLEDAPAPVLDGPLENRPIGGLGLHMVRSMGMALSYRREGSRNVLHVGLPAE